MPHDLLGSTFSFEDNFNRIAKSITRCSFPQTNSIENVNHCRTYYFPLKILDTSMVQSRNLSCLLFLVLDNEPLHF